MDKIQTIVGSECILTFKVSDTTKGDVLVEDIEGIYEGHIMISETFGMIIVRRSNDTIVIPFDNIINIRITKMNVVEPKDDGIIYG